jgi:hypothetical protein
MVRIGVGTLRAPNLRRGTGNFNRANLLMGSQTVAKIPDGHEPHKSQVGALFCNKFGTVHTLFRFLRVKTVLQ